MIPVHYILALIFIGSISYDNIVQSCCWDLRTQGHCFNKVRNRSSSQNKNKKCSSLSLPKKTVLIPTASMVGRSCTGKLVCKLYRCIKRAVGGCSIGQVWFFNKKITCNPKSICLGVSLQPLHGLKVLLSKISVRTELLVAGRSVSISQWGCVF